MKFYKKIIFGLLISLIAMSLNVKAQGNRVENLVEHDHQPYHFGFILSFNQMNFSLKTNDFQSLYSNLDEKGDYVVDIGQDSIRVLGINNQPAIGFTVGIVSNLKLTPLLDLRFIPSLAFGERELNYSFIGQNIGDSIYIDSRTIQSTHIDLPLYIKFKSLRAHNMRAYVLSGIKYTLDLSANSKKNEDSNGDLLKLRRHDLLFEAGFGFDFYLPYFKFGVELKMSYGFNHLLVPDQRVYTTGIESLKSKLFQISFTFE